MVEREAEPRVGVRLPDRLFWRARVDPKEEGDVRPRQLARQADVLRAEAAILVSDVEGEECGTPAHVRAERRNQVVDAPRRRVRHHAGPARVRRLEVAAPGLDYGERGEVVDGEQDGAVTARREADERAAAPMGDRPVARIDVA